MIVYIMQPDMCTAVSPSPCFHIADRLYLSEAWATHTNAPALTGANLAECATVHLGANLC